MYSLQEGYGWGMKTKVHEVFCHISHPTPLAILNSLQSRIISMHSGHFAGVFCNDPPGVHNIVGIQNGHFGGLFQPFATQHFNVTVRNKKNQRTAIQAAETALMPLIRWCLYR